MEIVAVIPCQDIRIESGKTSLYNVFPRFYVPRTGNVVAFSVMVVLLNEEGDRETYPLTIGIRDPKGETLYEVVIHVPAGDAGRYTMQIHVVAAEVTGAGVYHLDVTLDDKDFFILPLAFEEMKS